MKTNEQGLSLIEMMIALLLASLLMSLLIQHYLCLKKQTLHSQSLVEQGFELQLITELMRDRIRRAGFTPCLPISVLQTNKTLSTLDFSNGKIPFLQINHMSEYFTQVIKQLSPNRLEVSAETRYQAGDLLLISDCYHAELQEVLHSDSSKSGTKLLLKKTLSFNYQQPIYVGEWLRETFFIQSNHYGKPALFYKNHDTEELSTEINNLAVTVIPGPKTLVQVQLTLSDEKRFLLETMVRAE